MANEDRQDDGRVGLTPAPRAAPACPLCGGPNGCESARSGRFDTPCWCLEVRFDASLLARVPVDKRGIACICRACAEAASERAT